MSELSVGLLRILDWITGKSFERVDIEDTMPVRGPPRDQSEFSLQATKSGGPSDQPEPLIWWPF